MIQSIPSLWRLTTKNLNKINILTAKFPKYFSCYKILIFCIHLAFNTAYSVLGPKPTSDKRMADFSEWCELKARSKPRVDN